MALALAGCGKQQDDMIDPVPPPTAESAARLMSEAERAAANAQQRINRTPASSPARQGDAK